MKCKCGEEVGGLGVPFGAAKPKKWIFDCSNCGDFWTASEVPMTPFEIQAQAYRHVAKTIRNQISHVKKSGYGFFSRRCAVLNLEGIAELCDEWANESESLKQTEQV